MAHRIALPAILTAVLLSCGDTPEPDKDDGDEPASLTAPTAGWRQISLGRGFACAVRVDGELYCFGDNSWGRLGNGEVQVSAAPYRVGAENDWHTVALGTYHACATKDDGRLFCWGSNYLGELGDGTGGQGYVSCTDGSPEDGCYRSEPTEVDAGSTWLAVGAGFGFTCGIRTEGGLYCWGAHGYGQNGAAPAPACAGNPEASVCINASPVQVEDATSWTAVSAGASHAVGLQGTAAIVWGDNYFHQATADDAEYATPTVLPGGGSWQTISARGWHSCLLNETGDAFCIGSNFFGESGTAEGLGYEECTSASPDADCFAHDLTTPLTDGPWHDMAAGNHHSCGITLAGTVRCFGYNEEGQLGDGTFAARHETAAVSLPGRAWQVAGGEYNSCAILEDGSMYCWGSNASSQLGTEDPETTHCGTSSQCATEPQKVQDVP